MKHEWEPVDQGVFGMLNYGKRRCKNCRKEQTKRSVCDWMRVIGYQWEPLVGRCPGKVRDVKKGRSAKQVKHRNRRAKSGKKAPVVAIKRPGSGRR